MSEEFKALEEENKKLRKACQNIRTYLEIEIKGKLAYIELMEKVSDTDEFYDAAKTNIMATEKELIDYNWIFNQVKQVLLCKEIKKG